MGLQEQILMDKYMMVVLGFLMIGIPIAFLSPTTGELREQPFIPLFYASIGGIIVVIVYSGYKGKKARQQANRERRRKFKK
jgi:NADH:ubiquinone oxidoreductase subunit 3 (subunit A)